MQDTVRVAAVQMKMCWYEDAAAFAAAVDARVAEAKAHRAELVVFPEDVGLPLIALGDVDIARSSQRISMPASAQRRPMAGRKAAAASRCTRRVSRALQIV